MAELTFPLVHGLRTGKGTTDEMLHKDVTLRELTSRDVIESQLASERVVIGDNGKAVAYCSEVMMGLETVSYTHLDVYKRQVLHSPGLVGVC